MSSKDEIIEKKKNMLREAIDFCYSTNFIETIDDFDNKNKRQLILLLRNYRNNMIIDDDEEKNILNHMIAEMKNIPTIDYKSLEPKLEFTSEPEIIRTITKKQIIPQKIKIEDINIKKKKQKKKKDQIKKFIKKEIKKDLTNLSLPELINEAYKRLEITKNYIEIVTEKLKYEK